MFTEGLRRQLDQGHTNPEIQAAIIRKFVYKIEVLPEGYEIFYHAGQNHYSAGLGSIPGSAFFHFPNAKNEKRPASGAQIRGEDWPHFVAPRKSVAGSTLVLIGSGETKLVEPRSVTVCRDYGVLWKRQEIDLSELRRLWKGKKHTAQSLAAHFGVGRTSIKTLIRGL